jgi:O-antigen/teichoic acid export membrane protein
MACQALYLLTSIGLNLTSRTEFYPVATLIAAAAGLSSGALLMPRYGITGAAAAFLVAYAVQAMAAFAFAQRVYPMRYE